MNARSVALTALLVAVITIVALVTVLIFGSKVTACGPGKASRPTMTHDEKSSVFADLTPAEFSTVLEYLKNCKNVTFTDVSKADPSSNCIYSVVLQLPAKQDVLSYLDHGGVRPAREALAVVYLGNQSQPDVREYVVGPLPQPTYCRDETAEKYKGIIPYHRRPALGSEYQHIARHLLEQELPHAPTFLREVLGYNKEDPAFFMFLTSAPRGYKSGDRSTWFSVFYNTRGSGFYLHPVGLEILFDHRSLDAQHWSVQKVFYHGQYLDNMQQLEERYRASSLYLLKMTKPLPEEDYGSTRPLRSAATDTRLHSTLAGVPRQYEPQGPRYHIRNNQVLFQRWSLAYGSNANSGLRLFDIRFGGERIVYELSIQDAVSVYGSNAPTGMVTRYMDGHFGIGRFMFQLVHGIDCPHSASYLDTFYLLDSDSWVRNKDSVCVFEFNSGLPLRRHFSSQGSPYYGGLVSTVLVIRSIATLGNYDYVFDFLFYQNGAIEAKVHATGYISSSFYMEGGANYGNRVAPHTLGTIHNHFINYKVDLDVGGTNNSVVTHDMEFESIKVPWNPEWQIERTKLIRKVLEQENQAAFQLHSSMPRYVQFASKKKNKWGHERSYRLQMVSFAGDYLPEKSTAHNSMNWANYKLAITKRKDQEHESSSIYHQNDPWNPTVKFSKFINGENIKDTDLVAWITTGFLHIPHAEDIPNTVTAGNGVGFYLRPYNYFNEDPSVHSADAVYFEPHDNYNSCSSNPLACLSDTTCYPQIPSFSFSGFDNLFAAI